MSEGAGIEVEGGAGGITARYADMLALARLFDDVGDDARAAAAEVGVMGAELAGYPELLVAGALSPGTAAEAAGALAAATAGPHGLLRLVVDTEGEALFLQLAVQAYQDADALMATAVHGLDNAAGYALGVSLPVTGPSLALAGGGLLLLAGPDTGERMLVDHPGVVEHLADGAPGLENGLLSWLGPARFALGERGFPLTYEDAVANLALFFRDGNPVLGPGGPAQDGDNAAPRTVADLLLGVDRRQTRIAPAGAAHAVPGEIGVKRLVGSDGRTRYVVELPGTETWPLVAGTNPRDTSTNLHTMAGRSTVYLRGVELALERAGVNATDDVMLVGHSQGGMTAAALAADPGFRARFHVTHVVTAGAPIARDTIPASVQVLALENRNDIVPQLDGAANPDRPNITTVLIDHNTGSISGNHNLAGYAADSQAIPSADPSYRAWLDSARGFLDPEAAVRNQRYAITRGR